MITMSLILEAKYVAFQGLANESQSIVVGVGGWGWWRLLCVRSNDNVPPARGMLYRSCGLWGMQADCCEHWLWKKTTHPDILNWLCVAGSPEKSFHSGNVLAAAHDEELFVQEKCLVSPGMLIGILISGRVPFKVESVCTENANV